MISPQRCGTVDKPHIFVQIRIGKNLRRCQLCNKHIRDVHISDYLIDSDYPKSKEIGTKEQLGL